MLLNRAFELIEPKPIVPPSEWAKENIYFPSEITNYAGKFNLNLNPFIQKPLDSVVDINTKRVILNFASQVGKTTIQSILSIWLAIHRSQPQLWVFPTSSLATSFSKERLQKLMANCDAIKPYLPDNQKDHFTNLSMMLKCCTISLTGSNQPHLVKSRPIGNLFIDEQDSIKHEHSDHSGSVSLAIERTKSFDNSLIVMASTPSIESNTGELIADNFRQSNQQYFHVACLDCGHLAPIDFSNEEKFHVVWDRIKDATNKTDVNKACLSARIKCPKCGSLFNDEQKHQMLLHPNSQWIAENPNGNDGWEGFHANSLMSAWIKIGEGVRQFYQAKGSVNALRGFTNGFLAQTFYHTTEEAPDAINLTDLESEYEKGQIPPKCQTICLVDVQKYEFKVVVLAKDETGCFFIIDWIPDSMGFNQIQEISDRYKCEHTLIDARFNTQVILKECESRNWIPSRAFQTMTGFFDMQPISPEVGRKEKYGKKIYEFRWNKLEFSRQFFRMRNGEQGNFFLYKNAEYELKKELCAEVEIQTEDKKTGRTKYIIKKIYSHEHASDNTCLGISFFNFLNGQKPIENKVDEKPINKKPIIISGTSL
jgi:hypothetical protein